MDLGWLARVVVLGCRDSDEKDKSAEETSAILLGGGGERGAREDTLV